jgi:hypothetical protein
MRDWNLFLRLILIVGVMYVAYALIFAKKVHDASDRSAKIAQEWFSNAHLNDSIIRIDKIYADSCDYGFWISNYSMDYVVVDLCKYISLKQISIGDRIIKKSNSNECLFIKTGGRKLNLSLQIEY